MCLICICICMHVRFRKMWKQRLLDASHRPHTGGREHTYKASIICVVLWFLLHFYVVFVRFIVLKVNACTVTAYTKEKCQIFRIPNRVISNSWNSHISSSGGLDTFFYSVCFFARFYCISAATKHDALYRVHSIGHFYSKFESLFA